MWWVLTASHLANAPVAQPTGCFVLDRFTARRAKRAARYIVRRGTWFRNVLLAALVSVNAMIAIHTLNQRTVVSGLSDQRPDTSADFVLRGTTRTMRETSVRARTSGYVCHCFVGIGAKVNAGELLAEIEVPQLDQQLNQARASAAQSSANFDFARATLTRWEELMEKKVVSSQEFEEKEAATDARRAEVNVAQANITRLEELQGLQKIISPFAGIITARNIKNGTFVSTDSAAESPELFRIARIDALLIYVNVPQTYAPGVVVGQNARVYVREIPGHTFDARVVGTGGGLEPVSRTLLTEVQVANADGQLFPGMNAEVRFAPNRAVASTAHALLRPPFTYMKGFILPKSLQSL